MDKMDMPLILEAVGEEEPNFGEAE